MSCVIPPPSTAEGLLTPRLLTRFEDGEHLHALIWSPGPGWRMASSAVLGGGIGERAWVLNAQVSHGYRRTDPDRHLASLAAQVGAQGLGVGVMTAADVSHHALTHDGGVSTLVTAGVTVRGWAASPALGTAVTTTPGTINIVAALPVALSDGALVNAVATATEAKVQALLDAGLDCSGTPTDAVCIAARSPGRGVDLHAFAGPRSLWGSRLARAVHRGVLETTRVDGHGDEYRAVIDPSTAVCSS
ncbi:adenosylcobinamide amidohydrolase [Streptomyces sp. NPDC059819]|uniref:adenosylcobinamide amidohydrolase n=1 Tax=Streptomyces sp. NPDC059819 TaxID=3346963 RepID=UPI00365E916D